MFRRCLTIAAGCIASGLALCGCYDSRFEAPPAENVCQAATSSLASLRGGYAGKPFTVEAPVTVTGIVTSSDRAGNFYRSLCIEEDHAALEVMAGIDQLHNDFPVGSRVVLQLEGLVVGQSRGVLQAGRAAEPGSGYDVDYIGSRAALDRSLARCGEELEEVVPALRTISGLEPRMCGTLVRIEGLQYAPEEGDESEAGWAGYRRFVNDRGEEILTYVRTYADFADDELPLGRVALAGILQYDDSGDGHYILKLRDENDCSEMD